MELAWTSVAPGVWRATLGHADNPTLLTAANARPAQKALEEMARQGATFPISLQHAQGETQSEFAVARMPLAADEKLFGLGMQMHGSNRRGEVFHLRVDHYASGHDRLHAPVPLYVSSKGYAVFFNTSRPISIYAGVGNRRDANNPAPRDRNTDPHWDAQPPTDAVEASVQGPGLEVYVFEGPTAMEAIQRYNLFCGGGVLPASAPGRAAGGRLRRARCPDRRSGPGCLPGVPGSPSCPGRPNAGLGWRSEEHT